MLAGSYFDESVSNLVMGSNFSTAVLLSSPYHDDIDVT